MDLRINNIDDLRNEVARLEGVAKEQKTALGARFAGPSAIFSTVLSIFPKSAATDGLQSSFANQDIVGLLSRIVLPFTLNKTLFRNSNFIVKTLVGLVSQKASHFISEDSVGGLWDKAKSLFGKIGGGKKEKAQPKDLQAYGIPKV
jgi:hypothetical protein